MASLGVIAAVFMSQREEPLPPTAGSPARVRLMTAAQFQNSIHYVFGPTIDVGSAFAPLPRTDGLLALSTSSVSVTLGQMQDFQRAAASVAAQVMSRGDLELSVPAARNTLIPCQPQSESAPDDACAETFVRRVGRLLFRRPLSEEKVQEYVQAAHVGAQDLNDFYAGLQTVLEGMLISPNFLLIQDTVEPDPDRPGKFRLDGYGLASRLSFLLWDSVPDEELLQAAESGELFSKRGRKRQVERMLASPRVEAGVRAFFDDMFAFDHFGQLSKDPQVYPMVTGSTLRDAREQTLRTVVDHLLTKSGDYRDLFTTRSTFLSPTLGPVYEEAAPPGWTPYEFPEDSGRAGLLTHVSFLALHAHPGRSSATLRGKALREIFLCQVVPPPPPNVDFSAIEDPDPSMRTARQRLEVHRTNSSCAGCHKITDPIGLGLEQFDGAGRFRTTENDAPIDPSGELDGRKFADAADLGRAVRDNPGLPSCLVKRVYSYATGGPLLSPRDPVLKVFEKKFADAGYRVRDLLREVAMSEALFRIVDAPARKPMSAPEAAPEAEAVFTSLN